MLDNEPDTNNQTPSSSDAPAEAAPATTPPRRRRAASRPAGPPASSAAPSAAAPPADAPPVDSPPPVDSTLPVDSPPPVKSVPVAELTPAEPPAPTWDVPAPTDDGDPAAAEPAPTAKKTAKRAPAKRTAKKVAASGDEVPKTRAPRKRAAKKTAASDGSSDAAQTQPELLVEVPADEPIAPTSSNDIPNPFANPEPVAEPEETLVDSPPDGGADLTAEAELPASTDELDPIVAEDLPSDASILADLPDPDEIVDEVEPIAEVESEPESDDAEDSDTDDSDAEASDEDSGDGSRRRRRRRGGRRRRRTGGDDDSDSDQSGDAEAKSDDDGPSEGTSESTADATEASDGDDDGKGESDTQRRRRRRRRRGEDAGSAPDDPTEVVVRVREPRRTPKVNNEVTGIEGSTRMEAKRQRRRDGREAGRRRPPILSEAEFLARREAVSRKMIIRQHEDLTQIAVLEDNVLVEHYVDRDSAASLIGNVYLGRVQNVLPSMEAAFIDIGRGRNAVVYAGEIDWDSFGAEGQNRKVEKVLKSGQTILVQVSKDPIGAKGARLTNHVSIPGRYIVYAPGGHLSGISRKLPDVERKRLRDVLADLVPESASVIVRTAAEGASEEELIRDVSRLKAQWEDIERKVASGSAPQLLYGEPDLTVRIVRDLFTEDFSELIIDGNGGATDAYDAVDGYVSHVAPHLKDRIRRWESEDGRDVFASYRLDEQIAKALERKVFLPSGGSLVIDRTEAMTVIDVNTGKFTGSGGNLEATVTSNNLEAAEEIVRQLRLRDIGGIIVIDFIDMVLPNNRELLLRRLVECLSRDRTRHQVAEVTSLGLVQMTRKKIGTGLLEAFTSECSHCNGRGVELHDMPVESQKQADGGAREPRPRDQRRGGGTGGGSNGPKPTEPPRNLDHGQTNGDSAQTSESESDEDRPSRSRRGGRSRRGAATRQQGAPVEPGAPEESGGSAEPSAPADPGGSSETGEQVPEPLPVS